MDNQNKNNLYFPLFYKYSQTLSALSKEEIGELIYAILASDGSIPSKEPLDSKLAVIYNIIVSDASRLFLKNASRDGKNYSSFSSKKTQPRYSNATFDIDEAFKKAVERSMGCTVD